ATKSGQVQVNTAKQSSPRVAASISAAMPVNTVVHKLKMNDALPTNYSYFQAHSSIKRPINKRTAVTDINFNKKVSTDKVNNVTTAGPNAVVSTAEGNGENAIKSSACRIWRPTENIVTFGGSPKGGKITGKGKIRTEKLDFEDVYFVKELKFNLFYVSQMCDKKNSVFFTETECLVLSSDFKLIDENQVLLKVLRQKNMYSFDLKNVVPSGGLTCLFAKATIDESNLWHRRLGHTNFKTMNKLVRKNLVRGLPSKIFENDHTYVACQKEKQHKASCETKLVSSINQPLQMLHMNLFGPAFVKSLNKKMYCLVVTDDFSRMSSPYRKQSRTGLEATRNQRRCRRPFSSRIMKTLLHQVKKHWIKPMIDTLSMDDLYKNLKVYESEIKSQSSSISNSQNVAFVSLDNPSITNKTVNIAHGVSAASSKDQAFIASYADDVIQISDIDKTGLGYDGHVNKSEVLNNVVDSCESDDNQVNDRFKNDNSVLKSKVSETIISVHKNEVNASKASKDSLEKSNTVRSSAPVIEDWESDAKTNNFNEKVNTAKVNNVTTAGTKAVVITAEGKRNNNVKSSACWISRPKGNLIDHISKDSGSYTLKRFNYVDLQGRLKHMIGNKSSLTNYQELDCGFVTFGGNANGCKITGKVSHKCVTKKQCFFTDTECVVLSLDFKLLDESQVLLKVPRNNNLYSFDLKNVVPVGGLACLFIKATLDESNLWHRRLGHIKFKTINKLVRENLVRGLPLKVLKMTIHVLLFRRESNTKPPLRPRLIMNEFCEMKGIRIEFSVARTPQQNVVAERKNRKLIEVSRTMLADSKLPTTFWAEAVNTDCYVRNRVLVIKHHNKTPYELFLGREPALSFMGPFGCPITILNTFDHLGNQNNGNVGTKANINAGQAVKKIVPGPQYVLLPLFTIAFQGPKSPEDEIADEAGKKSTKVPRKENEEEKEYKEMSLKVSLDKTKDANGNRMFTLVSAAGSTYDTADLQDFGIFCGAYDDEVKGAKADFNNLELTTVFNHNTRTPATAKNQRTRTCYGCGGLRHYKEPTIAEQEAKHWQSLHCKAWGDKHYVESKPLCFKCYYHHDGPCAPKCHQCNRFGHLARDCRSSTNANTTNIQKGTGASQKATCYECGNQGHYRRDCPEQKNQNHENQIKSTKARGVMHAIGGGETEQDLNNIENEIEA
nr:putative ribonuclease H-like domain-containing protein [Tanacetum cinerariifolium]